MTAFTKRRVSGRNHFATGSLRLPDSVETPKVDLTEWGGRFPDQQYYPMYLGNGRDAMLINLMGSGDGHWERPIRGAYPLSRLLNVGWYKADRREFANTDLVYGPLVPFVEFTAGPMLRGEVVVPRELSQYFDPRTATLTTFFGQRDNRTEQWLRLRSQTWLTADGLLVQAVTFLEVPDCGAQYQFTLGEPSPDYQNTKIPMVRPREVIIEAEGDGRLVHYRSAWEQGTAVGFSLMGGTSTQEWRRTDHRNPSVCEIEQVSALCQDGDTVWRILSVQDSKEGDDPEARCHALREKVGEIGLEGLRQSHEEEWEAYFSTSRVSLPDRGAQFLYEVSRYTIKANLHPCGHLPMGSLPSLWQGAMFWDASFGQQALLGCGNLAEAASIAGHLVSLSDQARQLAKDLGCSGARIEWTVNLYDFSKYDPPCLQIHNNAVWAHCLFVLADYRDQLLDGPTLALARDLLIFLLDRLHPAHNSTAPLIGIDESYSDPKPNDTWTLGVALKALEDYQAYCQAHGLELEIPRFHTGIQEVRERLAANTDEHGVLQSFFGGRLPHWGSLVFELFPDSPAALPTLAKMSLNHDPERDLFNFHGLNRYAERAFPWANNWVARSLGRMARPEALRYWLNNTRATNYFGGVPERVFYHGENYIDWCMTGHASQVWAMNAILADFRNDALTVLGGIDRELWDTLAFENIHVGNGLAVSLKLEAGIIRSLRIRNFSKRTMEITVRAPHHDYEQTLTLAPGLHPVIGPNDSEPAATRPSSSLLQTS